MTTVFYFETAFTWTTTRQISYHYLVVTVDGKYTEWSQWTECTATCGGGTQSRSRSCTNPAAQNGGKSCLDQGLGPELETQMCNVEPCPSKYIYYMAELVQGEKEYCDWFPERSEFCYMDS